jgi:hypothetical protein
MRYTLTPSRCASLQSPCAPSSPAESSPVLCPFHPYAAARFVLDQWPGSRACNDKTWLNDCTSQMTATVNGTSVLFTPAVGSAFNEQCDPAPGVVIGPKGTQAAVTFPQYPIAITSTGPDGSLMLDFSVTAGDDPNQMDWSQCIVSYKIIQGSFLNPQLALAGQQSNARIPGLQGAVATSGAHGRTSSAAVAAGVALATALLVTV